MRDDELRRISMTSSDQGALWHADENRDEWTVAALKRGLIAPIEPDNRMLAGKYFERPVAQWYADVTGEPFEWLDDTVQHPVEKWMVTTPDAVMTRMRRGWEVKLVSWDQRHLWGRYPEDVPEKYQLQVIWHMAVMEYDSWSIVARLGEEVPRSYTYYRDAGIEKRVIARARRFWERYVVGDEMPEIGGSEIASAWLQRTYARHRKADIRAASEAEIAVLREYEFVRIEEKAILKERDVLENRLKQAIGEAEGLKWFGGKFTWKATRDREIVDWKSMAIGLRNQFITDPAQREELEQFYTATKPGSRRIRLDSRAFKEQPEAA
jgi:predicted phage-related endonuclease